MNSAQVSIGSTATSIVAADSSGWREVVVKNTDGTNSTFLGASGVTTATGFRLAAGATVSVKLAPGDDLFGVATVSSAVHVLVGGPT